VPVGLVFVGRVGPFGTVVVAPARGGCNRQDGDEDPEAAEGASGPGWLDTEGSGRGFDVVVDDPAQPASRWCHP
jgi:hypothetical protein